jgi:general stress protein 26
LHRVGSASPFPNPRVAVLAATPEVKLHELLAGFGVGMLVTRTHDGHLRGRPVAVAEVEPGGTVWFVSVRHAGKVDELEGSST